MENLEKISKKWKSFVRKDMEHLYSFYKFFDSSDIEKKRNSLSYTEMVK